MIYPGEMVQCWRSSDNIRVILRKHRDVFFDINLKHGATYRIHSTSFFYSPLHKKLLRKVEFQDGDRFNVWVGCKFQASLVLKTDGRVMGTYEVNQLDTQNYDANPKTKPEPLMVIMGQRATPATLVCTPTDPFGVGETQQFFKASFDPKLSLLKDFGTDFDYRYPPQLPEVRDYVAVTEAITQEIQPQVLVQLENGLAVVGRADEIFVAPAYGQENSLLYRALADAIGYISGTESLTSNSFKESMGYLQENFKNLNKVGMTVRVEKRVKGKYRVVLKGRPLTKMFGQILRAGPNVSTVHERMPLGSKGSAFIDGGFGKSRKAGYGGIRRIILTTSENFRGGMKIQIIGTVIDLVVDVNTVFFDEKGSKDLSEFLGRAGVSLGKAGATAAIGSVFAAIGVAALSAAAAAVGVAALPMIAVVGIVIGGYILAATIVDALDDNFQIKNQVAQFSR